MQPAVKEKALFWFYTETFSYREIKNKFWEINLNPRFYYFIKMVPQTALTDCDQLKCTLR